MSMSTHVVGIRPATDDYKKKLAAYQACEEAGVPIPEELRKYFCWETPNPLGMQVPIEATRYQAEFRNGLDVDVTKLPEGVTIIRFYNAY